jgi:hypothetical protein
VQSDPVRQVAWTGARLSLFADRWDLIGSGALVRTGLQPMWSRSPPVPTDLSVHGVLPPPLRLLLEEAIQKELQSRVIQVVDRQLVLWLSPIFFVPKPDGTFRKIVDCSGLNVYLLFPSFQMEDQRLLAQLLLPRLYACKLDVKDAYHHVRVNHHFSFFLCFQHNGVCYRYLGMPFGVSPAPHAFTAIMHQCVAAARRIWNITILFYLDDILILHKDPIFLRQAVSQICAFFSWLGWIINLKKSDLQPRQQFVYLGWLWDSVTMTVRLTNTKVTALLGAKRVLAVAAR